MDFQGRLTTRRSGNQDLINSERFPMIKKISNDHMVVTFPSTRNNILSMTGKMSRTHTLMQELKSFWMDLPSNLQQSGSMSYYLTTLKHV